MSAAAISVRAVDYANPRDAAALVALLDAYASDPAGGGEPLAPAVKAQLPSALAQRVAQQMLAAVEATARQRGACKLTLEVLQGNAPALRTYTREGFVAYALDPAWGEAQLMQKLL